MHVSRPVMAVCAILATVGILYPLMSRGTLIVRDDQLQEIPYVDIKSGEAFLLVARTSVAEHPGTGEMTLVPGMYCEKCQSWKAAGPMDALQTHGAVRRCSIHKTPLVREGPLPDRL